MGIEIERRFLVDGRGEKPWRRGIPKSIVQFYLEDVEITGDKINWNGEVLTKSLESLDDIDTWRVRRIDEKYILTAKGRRKGSTASEYEWEVSERIWKMVEAMDLPGVIKVRYCWKNEDGYLWEVDEYNGILSGLIIAEVELEEEGEEFAIPDWAKLELTHLDGWSNSALSAMIRNSIQN